VTKNVFTSAIIPLFFGPNLKVVIFQPELKSQEGMDQFLPRQMSILLANY
jgi:hypothetical protein